MRTLTIVELTKTPLPGNPTSQVCPVTIGLNCSQLGWVAARAPVPSGAEMSPFHGVPEIDAVPPSRNTTSNDVIGDGNDVLVIRTAPLNPPLHTFVVTTSTVTPPPDTATFAWSEVVSTSAHATAPSTSPAAHHDER